MPWQFAGIFPTIPGGKGAAAFTEYGGSVRVQVLPICLILTHISKFHPSFQKPQLSEKVTYSALDNDAVS